MRERRRPSARDDLVKNRYELPELEGKTTVAVKIIEILGLAGFKYLSSRKGIHVVGILLGISEPKPWDAIAAHLNRDKKELMNTLEDTVRRRNDIADESAVFEALQMSAARSVMSLAGRYPLPNLVEVMANLMTHTTPPVRLTRWTLLEIIKRAPDRQAVVDNPNEFATVAVRIIKQKLADQLVEGIQYEKLNRWYEMTQLDVEIETWEQYLAPATHSIYDHVVCDSKIERQFVDGLERRDDVKLYLKLPAWFTVPTPIGEYNPDWAIVMEDRDAHGEPTAKPLLYLVRETKSTPDRDKWHPDERRKVTCGERHFQDTLGVDYKVVVSAGELP